MATDANEMVAATGGRLKVLALSYLFPNRVQPAYGIFVLNRLRAVLQYCDMEVVAPVQWYPLMRYLRRGAWSGGIPQHEVISSLSVHHPRFAVIPRFMKWLDAITYLGAARRVANRLRAREFAFDLVDAHWTYPDIVAGHTLARVHRKALIVTVRGHEALYLQENTIRRRLVAHFLRKADAVVTLSPELRDKVIALGVAADRVKVILNGVDLSHFRLQDPSESRRRLGIPPDKRIVISVGRLTEGKGHQDLIRAIAEVSREESIDLHIIGGFNPEENFEGRIRGLIESLGLSNVHLVSGVAHGDLPAWYGAADLFCLASKREGCPNVVLEALACGTPVVATDVGAVGEMVIPGKNGFLVGPGHDGSFAAAIRQALSRPWNRAQIAADMSRWSWQHCGEQVYHLYQTVLRGRA